ncbi:DMT family transporter [Taklimakanibacter lacteus]|uniref:DMT family transporter n=1 Tax=Taklimakanibacter lacteus TaxID=2268456 RepID=UPI0013C433E7
MGGDNQRYLGWILVGLSAVAWSTAGFFTRLITEDVWTMLFWRGVFGGLAFLVMVAVTHRGKVLQAYAGLGGGGLLLAVTSGLGMIAFISSLMLTTVADVYVIYATVPFITAGVAWLILGERASWSVLAASALALIGVVVTLTGAAYGGSLIGQFIAFLMTLTMALMAVILRWKRDIPVMPALGLSAWIAAFVAFWFCQPFNVSTFDLAMLALFGVTQSALGLLLFGLGSRMVPAAEATLLTAIDIPLAPLWVWLAFGEMPGFPTLAGGVIVLAAVAGHMAYELRKPAALAVSSP